MDDQSTCIIFLQPWLVVIVVLAFVVLVAQPAFIVINVAVVARSHLRG